MRPQGLRVPVGVTRTQSAENWNVTTSDICTRCVCRSIYVYIILEKTKVMANKQTIANTLTVVKLQHWVSLAPLYGSVYITVLNCVCYVMFIWWFVLYYMHCPAWQILCNLAFVLQSTRTLDTGFWGPHRGLLLDRAGEFRPPDPLLVPPIANSWLCPCTSPPSHSTVCNTSPYSRSPLGNEDPHLTKGSLGSRNLHHKQVLDLFSR